MTGPIVALAGASGNLGFRIGRALVDRGAAVRALVRADIAPGEQRRLEAAGLVPVTADPGDASSLAGACTGAVCVVSALNGLREAILGRQKLLLEAAVQAGVPLFIPSDFSEDFTRTRPGRNRNLDLRREFMVLADQAPIRVTSILNGAFMDMLGAEMPIIQRRFRRILYWHGADQPLDFTTKDDVASFTAHVALDPDTPRILRVAGDTASARQIAEVMSHLSGRGYKPLKAGTIGSLGLMIGIAKLVAPRRGDVFPVWQGMQYMRDMFSGDGRLSPLDNHRYADVHFTTIHDHLSGI